MVKRNAALKGFWKAHRWLLDVTNGRVGARVQGMPVLLLTTTGRRSGEPRRVGLSYVPWEEGFAVIASNAGHDRHPAWYLNLETRPEATVVNRGRELAVRARVAEGAEREAIWASAVAAVADYAEYDAATTRQIPVVVLEPVAAPPPHPRIDPARWNPPRPPPLGGPLAPNSELAAAERWDTGGEGPEDVLVDGDGRVYTGLADGRILRFPPDGGWPEVVADTGGRPLGLEFDRMGGLVVCDAKRGLLAVAPGGDIVVLADHYEGVRLRFVNNAAVASDGTIYFSDSSTRFGVEHYRADLLEHRGNGRLFAYEPDSGGVTLLLDGLFFANGVALAQDESFVLVAETGKYRIRKLWLRGPNRGRDEPFTHNLPGIPDNLSRGPSGTFWAAMFTPRNKLLDLLLPRPRLRALAARLPEKLQPQPERYSFVLGFDGAGNVTHNLQDPDGGYAPITGVREHGGWLYLGSLTESAIARVRLD